LTSLREFNSQVIEARNNLDCVNDEEQYLEWAKKARRAKPGTVEEILSLFCGDCSALYQCRMVSRGLCRKPENKEMWEQEDID